MNDNEEMSFQRVDKGIKIGLKYMKNSIKYTSNDDKSDAISIVNKI
ncbi:MAG: hypothetical protein ACQEUT_15555 [Bacillota bacterium]